MFSRLSSVSSTIVDEGRIGGQCFVLLLFLRAYSIIRIRIWIHIESRMFSLNLKQDSM